MLRIIVPATELFDEANNKFLNEVPAVELQLEHSLVSLSKWESKTHRSFLSEKDHTKEDILNYFYEMILTPNVGPEILMRLTQQNVDDINAYIESSQTATTFKEISKPKGKPEIITSELIYYWMVALGIPFETQYWHLNRLLTLIRVTNIKNSKPEKMSKREAAEERRALNEARKKEYNTRG